MLRIGIVNPKGGTGKTTTAVHLARAIQKTGDDVAILDTDPQGSALAWESKRDGAYELPVVAANTDDVEGALEELGPTSSVLVIDGAAKIEPRTGRIVRASHVVLIPVQPTPLDTWGVEQVVSSVQSASVPAAFLITQQKPRTNLAAEVADGLASSYELPVFESRISHRVVYAESMFGGRTALDVSGATKAHEEIAAVTNELKAFIQRNV